jgi:acyl-CoA thioesterase I
MTVSSTPVLYAALGDSTGVGVGAHDGRGYVARLHERLLQQRPGVRLLNACISGATSHDLITRQLPRVLTARPALVTVFIGINDLIRGTEPAAYARNIEQVARALATEQARALFCTIPDLAYAPAAAAFMSALGVQRSLFETRTRALNAHVLESARAHGHAAHDLFGVSLQDQSRFFSSDGFHPSAHGYEELAEALWPPFEQLASGLG